MPNTTKPVLSRKDADRIFDAIATICLDKYDFERGGLAVDFNTDTVAMGRRDENGFLTITRDIPFTYSFAEIKHGKKWLPKWVVTFRGWTVLVPTTREQ